MLQRRPPPPSGRCQRGNAAGLSGELRRHGRAYPDGAAAPQTDHPLFSPLRAWQAGRVVLGTLRPAGLKRPVGILHTFAHEREGIEANLFFTFFGLDAIRRDRYEHIKVATVGNPGLHMPTMVGGLPAVSALATH